MNIAAIILTLVGAKFSLFRQFWLVLGLLLIACCAVVNGIGAAMRKNTFCVAGLAICGGVFLLSVALFSGNPSQMRNLPFNLRGMAMSIWMKTVFVWALCYLDASVCAYLYDYFGRSRNCCTLSRITV